MDKVGKVIDLVNELNNLAEELHLSISISSLGNKTVTFLSPEYFFDNIKDFDIQKDSGKFPYVSFTYIDDVKLQIPLKEEEYKTFVKQK